MRETDRSRILAKKRCPRLRFWGYEFQGKGLAPVKKALPLVFGSAFHEAAEDFLTARGVDAAISRVLAYLDGEFAAVSVDMEEPQTAYNVAEQKAIAEGLVRAWWAFNGERFLDTFEVIEVEQEGRATLSAAPELVLMFRPDALVQEKLTGDLYVVSWKTSSTFGKYVTDKCAVDMQSMSEVWGIQQSDVETMVETDLTPRQIEGVLYLFAVKGRRTLDDYDNIRKQNTPLAYAWMREGPTPEETEWSWAYEYTTEEMNEKTGKLKKTKLGKGWRKVPVWEFYPGGVKEWIDDLANQRITPRHVNALEAIFPEMLPVSRKAKDVESWRRQTVMEELRVEQAALAVHQAAKVSPEKFAEVLDREFPQTTDSCFNFARKCDFYDICWTEATAQDPLASGLYQIRVSNHPEKGDED